MNKITKNFLCTVAILCLHSTSHAGETPGVKLTEAQKIEANNQLLEIENESIHQQATHSFKLSSGETKVFNFLSLGFSTMTDINKISSIDYHDSPLCRAYKNCKYENLNVTDYGNLGKDSYSSNDTLQVPVTFASFNIEDQRLSATFFEGILIAVDFISSQETPDVNASVVAELRKSFDRKYKKIKSISSTKKDDTYISTYETERWMNPDNQFEVRIQAERNKIHNVGACLAQLNIEKAAGLVAAGGATRCSSANAKNVYYTLYYIHPEGFEKANSEIIRSKLIKAEASKKEMKNGVSKF